MRGDEGGGGTAVGEGGEGVKRCRSVRVVMDSDEGEEGMGDGGGGGEREWGIGPPGGVEDMERGIGPPVGDEGSDGTCGDDGVEHCAEMGMEDSTHPPAHQLGGGGCPAEGGPLGDGARYQVTDMMDDMMLPERSVCPRPDAGKTMSAAFASIVRGTVGVNVRRRWSGTAGV